MPFWKGRPKRIRQLRWPSVEVPARFESCARCYPEPFSNLGCAGSLISAIQPGRPLKLEDRSLELIERHETRLHHKGVGRSVPGELLAQLFASVEILVGIRLRLYHVSDVLCT